jgi:hypothetical protein
VASDPKALTELLPCPFCGGVPWRDEDDGVGCGACDVQLIGQMHGQAEAKWNSRALLREPEPTPDLHAEALALCEAADDWRQAHIAKKAS